MIRLLWLTVCSRNVSHVSGEMLGNMLDVTFADSSKHDSELHHLGVQIRQLTLPFLGEKQQFLASRSEVQNAKEDPPKKLESWKALHFSSLKKFKSLGTRIPYYYKFHPLWTWANEAAYTNSGDLRFNKFQKLKALMQEKNQLDSPKIEKNRNSFVVWGHFLHHSFPINFPSNLPTCMHEHLSPPLDAPFGDLQFRIRFLNLFSTK